MAHPLIWPNVSLKHLLLTLVKKLMEQNRVAKLIQFGVDYSTPSSGEKVLFPESNIISRNNDSVSSFWKLENKSQNVSLFY